MQKEKLDLILSIISASIFVLLLVVAAFMLFRIYLKRKNKLLLEKELMGIQFEQTLLQSKLEIQEQTFRDISQELHDNIGQMLSLVSINLNTMHAPDEADRIAKMDEPGAYEMFGVLAFLQHVPDRDRAREVFGRVGPLILERNLVALDPEAPGEVHGVLSFAPEPDSLARALFDDATVQAHLDHLAQGQKDDGGWTFNWPAWSPAAELDWRGFLTVDALRALRANNRL